MRVVALSAEDWDAGSNEARRESRDDALGRQGMDLFLEPLSGGRGSCINCHAVAGTNAVGQSRAPKLTHFADPPMSASRGAIGGDRPRERASRSSSSERCEARLEDAGL